MQSTESQDLHTLQLQVTALKSTLSDFALRARQAEQMAGRLMAEAHKEKWEPAQIQELAALISKQIDARAHERAVQQQGVIQATVFALGAALNETDPSKKSRMLVNIHRELSASVQHLEKIGQSKNG